jgi:hypothetical protein
VLPANTSSPQAGDDVVLQRTGRDTVTVKRAERGADGKLSPKEVAVFRNRWVIEKQSFLDARALRNSQDQRRFVAQVRSALADEIEQGEPLQPVRLRERAARVSNDRIPVHRE